MGQVRLSPCASAAAVTAVLGRVQHGVVVVVVVVVVGRVHHGVQHHYGHHGHTKLVLMTKTNAPGPYDACFDL